MAATGGVLFQVSVRDPGGVHQLINVRSGMSVRNIKEEFSRVTNIPHDSYRLVFAGRQLNDHDTLETLGLQSHSTLHCIRGRVNVTTQRQPQSMPSSSNIRTVESNLGAMTIEEGDDNKQTRFYVYCKSECKGMKPGKLRVRCSACKDEAFTLTTEPQDWNDVLMKQKLRGICHRQECGGEKYAEFFFKCGGHSSLPIGGQDGECVALHMIRTNTINIECPMCTDVKDTMVVFNCDGNDGHSLCLECFLQYTGLALTERRFIEHPHCGYTIQCPSRCENSYITEIHHFRLLGPEQYDRYQRFGTEECVLQMGGVLCPSPNCGMGMLPDNPGRSITCPECRFNFCRDCKSAYHRGDCVNFPTATPTGQGQQIDEERLRRSRWDRASLDFIRNNAAIKRCPNCNSDIEKNGGCMHMTCYRCRHEFCWLCLIPWGRACQDRHWFGERN